MRRLIAVLAIFEAFALSLCMMNLWYLAFLNGGTVTISINSYGEMWPEYLLWLVVTPILVLGLHYAVEEVGPSSG